jgi:hypothetical protein
MFVNEFFFSFTLLAFAALLCLSGLGMLIDGMIRLVVGWYKAGRPTVANRKAEEESACPRQQAA